MTSTTPLGGLPMLIGNTIPLSDTLTLPPIGSILDGLPIATVIENYFNQHPTLGSILNTIPGLTIDRNANTITFTAEKTPPYTYIFVPGSTTISTKILQQFSPDNSPTTLSVSLTIPAGIPLQSILSLDPGVVVDVLSQSISPAINIGSMDILALYQAFTGFSAIIAGVFPKGYSFPVSVKIRDGTPVQQAIQNQFASDSSTNSSGLSTTTIIIISVCSAVLLFILFALFFWKKRRSIQKIL